MKTLALLSSLLILMYSSATCRASAQDKTYDVVLQFQSFCCGVPDDEALQKAVAAFKKTYKLKKIYVDRIGPMGKEGEYQLCFAMNKMTARQRSAFIELLEKTAPLLKDPGQVTLEKNVLVKRTDLPARASIDRIAW